MFTRLVIHSPKANFKNTDDARNWLAACDPHRNLPPILFHRNQLGQTLNGPSAFRFNFSENAVILTGIGPASETLNELLPVIRDVVSESVGTVAQIEILSGACNLQVRPKLGLCKFSRLVIQSGPRNSPWVSIRGKDDLYKLLNEKSTEFLDHTKKILVDGIKAQCDILGMEYPQDAVLGDIVVTKSGSVPANKKSIYLATISGTFRSNLHFEGPWNVGRLHQKGAGAISS